MPGHKGADDFSGLFPGADRDVTELPYSGNLMNSEGVIGLAQNDIARILGAAASFITTDGSTSGIFAMLYVAKKRGGRVAVPRHCHMSVYNACAALGIDPLIIDSEISEGVPYPPSPRDVERTFEECGEKISACLIVSPDYYGNVADLAAIKKICAGRGALLLVDEAHGTHLFREDIYAGRHADIWVDGAHKSTPALTQGAVVSVAEKGLAAETEAALRIFRTSSPSYPIMASVEHGIKYLDAFPEKTDEAKRLSLYLKDNLGVKTRDCCDWTKVAADFEGTGLDAKLVEKALVSNGIYPELCDGRRILFYLSAETTESDIRRLILTMKKVMFGGGCLGECEKRTYPAPRRACGFLEAVNAPSEIVPLEEAEGRVSAVVAGVSPPCVPVVLPGETVTDGAVRVLCGKDAFGLENGCVRVMTNQESGKWRAVNL